MSKHDFFYFFYLYIEFFRESLLENLSLSLFMSQVETNYYNSSPSMDQLIFFADFMNRSPYFHICYLLP